MSTYVDGFVIPIPKNIVNAYKKMAQLGCKTWMKHGALAYFECVADDIKAPCGMSFPQMCKTKKSETVILLGIKLCFLQTKEIFPTSLISFMICSLNSFEYLIRPHLL